MKIKIDSEFAARIPPLRAEERAQLEANLIADGCRDPLVVWEETGILLDGYNRFEICKAHKIPFETATVDLPDREAAADWIDANQLGRRNLMPDHYRLLRGRRYNRAKRQGERTDLTSGNSCPKSTTAEVLAEQYGVSERTIKNDGQFAAAVETIKAVDPEIEAKVIRGITHPRAVIVEAAKVLQVAEDEFKAEMEAEEAAPLIAASRPAPDPRPAARVEAAAILNGEHRRAPDPAEEWEDKADKFEAVVNKVRGYASAFKKIEELDHNHFHFTARQRKALIHSYECIRQNIDHAINYLKSAKP